ncbi:MAG: transferase [Actinomycetota bacterium]|nr:transferase [Actinomycetota bacterium]
MTDDGSSIPAVQALLRVLAAGRDVAELGTAFGEAAAAIAETARSLVTVELDPERAAVARERLAGLDNVEALEGDAYELLRGRGPFGLVFADGGVYDWEQIIELLEPGALLVKDDLTPGRGVEGDPVREFLLRDPRLAAVEILTTPASAAIVASRRRPAPRRTIPAERS